MCDTQPRPARPSRRVDDDFANASHFRTLVLASGLLCLPCAGCWAQRAAGSLRCFRTWILGRVPRLGRRLLPKSGHNGSTHAPVGRKWTNPASFTSCSRPRRLALADRRPCPPHARYPLVSAVVGSSCLAAAALVRNTAHDFCLAPPPRPAPPRSMAFRVAFRRLAAAVPAGRVVVKAVAAASVASVGVTVAFCGSSPAPPKTLTTVPVVKDAKYYQAV